MHTGTLSRKRLLALALVTVLVIGILPLSLAAEPIVYTDVPETYWAYDAISAWSGGDNAILEGYKGKFLPETAISTVSLDIVIGKVLGNAGEWKSSDTITREAAIVKIAKAFGVTTVAEPKDADKFTDDASITAANKPYIYGLKATGVLTGVGGNEFNPKGTFTRAGIIQVVYNLISKITDKNVTGGTYNKDFVIRKTGVTLKDATVKGDLIVAQGVKDGDVTLDTVNVTGKLIVYGGGSSSIHIKGDSKIAQIVIAKVGGQTPRISIEGKAVVTTATVSSGNAIIGGTVSEVIVSAANAKVTAEAASAIAKVTVSANGVTIAGSGKVTEVVVTSAVTAKTTVSTPSTKVTNNSSADVVDANGKVIAASGKTGSTTSSGTATSAEVAGDTTGGGSSGGGGGRPSPSPSVPSVPSVPSGPSGPSGAVGAQFGGSPIGTLLSDGGIVPILILALTFIVTIGIPVILTYRKKRTNGK